MYFGTKKMNLYVYYINKMYASQCCIVILFDKKQKDLILRDKIRALNRDQTDNTAGNTYIHI